MVHHVGCGNINTPPEWTPCCWPDCESLAEGGRTPLCDYHFKSVGIQYEVEHRASLARLFELDHGCLTPAEVAAQRAAGLAAQTQVYYVRMGDHVKIGYTTNVRKRMSELRTDVENVLATEPGGRALERQRHREFDAERVGRRENFNPSRRLLAHIEKVKVRHGLPNLTSYDWARSSC